MAEQKDYEALFLDMHPGFFDKENIRNLEEKTVCNELILWLDEFQPDVYTKAFDSSVSFGYLQQNDRKRLLTAVEKVEPSWLPLYDENCRVYCGFIDGNIASFCMVEDMGRHMLDGRMLRIGGPGCVGTVPEARNRGIGLMMVKNATQILKEEGYDISYIHYTGIAPWYEKLGYKKILKWNKHGISP